MIKLSTEQGVVKVEADERASFSFGLARTAGPGAHKNLDPEHEHPPSNAPGRCTVCVMFITAVPITMYFDFQSLSLFLSFSCSSLPPTHAIAFCARDDALDIAGPGLDR